jgi:Skp family chaperone for outer membrane proteins
MKVRLLLLLLALPFAAHLGAQAPAAERALPRKLAVVDFDRVVIENTEGIKARIQVEVFLKEWQKKSDEELAKQKELRDKQVQLGLSETEKASLAKKIGDIDINLTRIREDADKDLLIRRTEVFSPVVERARNILKSYGEEWNLAAILNDGALSDGPVLFSKEVVDITTEVIRRLNADIEKNPIKAAAAGGPAPR